MPSQAMGSALAAQGALVGAEPVRPGVILHFDLRANQDSLRRRVDRFLFGSKETRIVAGIKKTYAYPGLLEVSGGRHFGQSVVLLRPEAAKKAIALFRELCVPHERLDILARDWDEGNQAQDTVRWRG